MTRPEVHRRLDQAEKDLLAWLTVNNVVEQTGCTWETAAAALADFAEQGRAVMKGDALDVYVEVAGHSLLHVERDWLAFYAHQADWESGQ